MIPGRLRTARRASLPAAALAAALGAGAGCAPELSDHAPLECSVVSPPDAPLPFAALYDEALSGRHPGVLHRLYAPDGVMITSPTLGPRLSRDLARQLEDYQARAGPVAYRSEGARAHAIGGVVLVTGHVVEQGSDGAPRRSLRALALERGGACGHRVFAEYWYPNGEEGG